MPVMQEKSNESRYRNVLNLLYNSSKTITTTGPVEILYVPNADAYYVSNPITAENLYRKMFLDGTILEVGTNSPFFNGFRYDNIDDKDGVVVTLLGDPSSYIIDRITWISDLTRPIATNMDQSILGKGLFHHDRSGNLKYYRPSGGGYIRYSEATGASEVTVVVTASYTIDTIHFMKDQQVVLFDKSAGRVFFYDVDSETLVLETSIDPSRTACYDTTYQNVVSIRSSDGVVQVYDSKPRPFKLSALSITPNLFERYQTEEISVTVLGSDEEPINNIDVQWEVKKIVNLNNSINTREINALEILAGSSFLPAKGKITPDFTKTNASGVATAVYCPPGLDWESGDTEVIIPTVKQ